MTHHSAVLVRPRTTVLERNQWRLPNRRREHYRFHFAGGSARTDSTVCSTVEPRTPHRRRAAHPNVLPSPRTPPSPVWRSVSQEDGVAPGHGHPHEEASGMSTVVCRDPRGRQATQHEQHATENSNGDAGARGGPSTSRGPRGRSFGAVALIRNQPGLERLRLPLPTDGTTDRRLLPAAPSERVHLVHEPLAATPRLVHSRPADW